MQLTTTYRGLKEKQAAAATQLLQRNTQRLSRLLAAQTLLRAVVEGESPEHRVILNTSADGADFNSEGQSHNLPAAIAIALNRLRAQIVRHRQRKEARRHRTSL